MSTGFLRMSRSLALVCCLVFPAWLSKRSAATGNSGGARGVEATPRLRRHGESQYYMHRHSSRGLRGTARALSTASPGGSVPEPSRVTSGPSRRLTRRTHFRSSPGDKNSSSRPATPDAAGRLLSSAGGDEGDWTGADEFVDFDATRNSSGDHPGGFGLKSVSSAQEGRTRKRNAAFHRRCGPSSDFGENDIGARHGSSQTRLGRKVRDFGRAGDGRAVRVMSDGKGVSGAGLQEEEVHSSIERVKPLSGAAFFRPVFFPPLFGPESERWGLRAEKVADEVKSLEAERSAIVDAWHGQQPTRSSSGQEGGMLVKTDTKQGDAEANSEEGKKKEVDDGGRSRRAEPYASESALGSVRGVAGNAEVVESEANGDEENKRGSVSDCVGEHLSRGGSLGGGGEGANVRAVLRAGKEEAGPSTATEEAGKQREQAGQREDRPATEERGEKNSGGSRVVGQNRGQDQQSGEGRLDMEPGSSKTDGGASSSFSSSVSLSGPASLYASEVSSSSFCTSRTAVYRSPSVSPDQDRGGPEERAPLRPDQWGKCGDIPASCEAHRKTSPSTESVLRPAERSDTLPSDTEREERKRRADHGEEDEEDSAEKERERKTRKIEVRSPQEEEKGGEGGVVGAGTQHGSSHAGAGRAEGHSGKAVHLERKSAEPTDREGVHGEEGGMEEEEEQEASSAHGTSLQPADTLEPLSRREIISLSKFADPASLVVGSSSAVPPMLFSSSSPALGVQPSSPRPLSFHSPPLLPPSSLSTNWRWGERPRGSCPERRARRDQFGRFLPGGAASPARRVSPTRGTPDRGIPLPSSPRRCPSFSMAAPPSVSASSSTSPPPPPARQDPVSCSSSLAGHLSALQCHADLERQSAYALVSSYPWDFLFDYWTAGCRDRDGVVAFTSPSLSLHH